MGDNFNIYKEAIDFCKKYGVDCYKQTAQVGAMLRYQAYEIAEALLRAYEDGKDNVSDKCKCQKDETGAPKYCSLCGKSINLQNIKAVVDIS